MNTKRERLLAVGGLDRANDYIENEVENDEY